MAQIRNYYSAGGGKKREAWQKRHAWHQHLNSCVCYASHHARMNALLRNKIRLESCARLHGPLQLLPSKKKKRTWDRLEWPHRFSPEEQYEPLMGNKGCIVWPLWWWRAEAIPGFTERSLTTTTRPRPDAGNCCVTAHMNTPKSALGLVQLKAKCTIQTIRGIQSQSLVPMATGNCRCDCMESGVSDNLSHVKTAFHPGSSRLVLVAGF